MTKRKHDPTEGLIGPDVSEFNPLISEAKQNFPFNEIRSNDGTYQDHHFLANLHDNMQLIARGLLAFFGVYFVYEENWIQAYQTFIDRIGHIHRPHMFAIIDVESWGGRITGDHSRSIRRIRERIINHLNSLRPRGTRHIMKWKDRRRVLVYANQGDRAAIAPHTGDANFIIANYDEQPNAPREILHQFTDHYPVPGLGNVDMNAADHYTVNSLARALGVTVAKRYGKVPAKRPANRKGRK